MIAALRALLPVALAAALLMLPALPANSIPLLIVVTSTNDPGDGVCNPAECTLREAIDDTNAVSDPDIHFNIPDSDPGRNPDGSFTIFTNGLPDITTPVNIDATTQPGYSGTPLIELNGSLTSGYAGFSVLSSTTTIKGFSITFFETGVRLSNGLNKVQANHIGVDVTGTSDQGNGIGVELVDGVGNLIGGESEDDRNIISGNDVYGILQGANLDTVDIWGNYIGTDFTGMNAIPNSGDGVHVHNALIGVHEFANNLVGSRNVISGNLGAGIYVENGMSVRISGNYIGTDRTGNGPLHNGIGSIVFQDTSGSWIGIEQGPPLEGNVIGDWIEITGNSNHNSVKGNRIGIGVNGAPLGAYGMAIRGGIDNVVGGMEPGEGNIIAHNLDIGVTIRDVQSPSSGNSVLGNSIYDNDYPGGPDRWGVGIDLRPYDPVMDAPSGPTLNDPDDVDTGPNGLQNFPELTSALSGSVTVQGTLDSTAGSTFRIEFFANDECDATGYGEGQTYLGFVNTAIVARSKVNAFEATAPVGAPASVDAMGEAEFTFEDPQVVLPGQFITATATNLTTGDTSEFSPCIEVQLAPTPTPGPTATPSPTPTATPSPTPTGSPAAKLTQGDVDCDTDVDSVDALFELRDVAALPVNQPPGCPEIGSKVASLFGDVDCDDDVDTVDALFILRHVAALPVNQPKGCPEIGAPL